MGVAERVLRAVAGCIALFLALPLMAATASRAEPSTAPGSLGAGGDRLVTVLQLDSVANGFALSPRGRTFVPLSRSVRGLILSHVAWKLSGVLCIEWWRAGFRSEHLRSATQHSRKSRDLLAF